MSSLFRNSTLETVFRPFPKQYICLSTMVMFSRIDEHQPKGNNYNPNGHLMQPFDCVCVVALLSATVEKALFQGAAQFLPKGCSRKMPPSFSYNLNGAVCSNTLFSNTSALTSSLLFWGNSTCKILEHLVCSNTSGFQFWGPLARTNLLSALCGLPTFSDVPSRVPGDEGRRCRCRPFEGS